MIILAINKETGDLIVLKCCLVSLKGHTGKVASQGGAYPILKRLRENVGEGRNLHNLCGKN